MSGFLMQMFIALRLPSLEILIDWLIDWFIDFNMLTRLGLLYA